MENVAMTGRLYEAFDKMKEAEEILREVNKGADDYGLRIIIQQLNKFSDNSEAYMTNNLCLEEIIGQFE